MPPYIRPNQVESLSCWFKPSMHAYAPQGADCVCRPNSRYLDDIFLSCPFASTSLIEYTKHTRSAPCLQTNRTIAAARLVPSRRRKAG